MRSPSFRLFFIGDIFGRSARNLLKQNLSTFKRDHQIDFVVGNGENAAGGFGITPRVYKELLESGIDVITSGNHIFDKKEIIPLLRQNSVKLLRPDNLNGQHPGRGLIEISTNMGLRVAILNIMGRVHMKETNCPFRAIDAILKTISPQTKIKFVDFHGEATSEKAAFSYYVDGKVSAVAGTHTHVQTNDERILPNGTGFITDVGMTGPIDSVIGSEIGSSIQKFLAGDEHKKIRCKAAKTPSLLRGAIFTIDPNSGKTSHVERINHSFDTLTEFQS